MAKKEKVTAQVIQDRSGTYSLIINNYRVSGVKIESPAVNIATWLVKKKDILEALKAGK